MTIGKGLLIIAGAVILAAVFIGVAESRAKTLAAEPKTFKQVACIYDGMYSFAAEDVSFVRLSDAAVFFKSKEGKEIVYVMRFGEVCAYTEATEEKDRLIKGE
ncbi:MAG TPA: hypothetical protein VGD26_00390 [Chitinophagaceae bacterium]